MKAKHDTLDVLRRAAEAGGAEVPGLRVEGLRLARSATAGDAVLTLRVEKRSYPYLAAVKAGTLSPAALPSLESLDKRCAADDRRPMVVAAQIGPGLAKLLRERGIAFMDAAGNAFLVAPGLHVWISGKRTGVKRVVTGLHRQSAVKIIFALLTDPRLDNEPAVALLNSPVRVLAKAAGVAMGSVGNVLDNLRSMGFLLEDDDARRLVERERLIELWATDYLAHLRHRLIHHRYRIASMREWERMPGLPPSAWWGGDVAGARLARHLSPEKMTIYSGALPDEWVVRAALQPDPDGNVEVLAPFWGDGLISLWQRDLDDLPKDCVHPLLVYADLLANDEERSSETAKRLYDKFLRKLASPD